LKEYRDDLINRVTASTNLY